MKSPFFVVLAATLVLVPSAWAQDTSDPLFTNPDPDSPADTSQKVPLDAYTGQTMKFFETFDVEGYIVSGFKNDGELVNSPYNALKFGFGTDMRLDRTARAYASFAITYPNPKTTADTNLYNPYDPPVTLTDTGDLSFSNIAVKELFLDYSLGNFAIVRLGRQTATWGQGRLFNPGNLVNGIGDGVAAKVSTVVGPFSLTTVAIKNDGLYLGDNPDMKSAFALGSIAGAGLIEYSSSWFSAGLSGFYHYSVGSKTDLYFKTSFLGADLFLDGLSEIGTTYQTSYTGVAGLYRDFGEKTKWLKLQAEWLVSGQGNSGSFTNVSAANLGFDDQTVGVAATSELLSSFSLKPSVLWLHSLADSSGQFVFGLVSTALPHINLTMALARIYGDEASRYAVNNPDSQHRVWSMTVKASFNFDIKS